MTETHHHVVGCSQKDVVANRLSAAERIRLLTRQVARAALDLLFPPHCVHCGRVGSLLCPHCLRTVTLAPPRRLLALDDVRAAVRYSEAVRAAVHAFKYEGVTHLRELFGEWLCGVLSDVDWHVDVVTAVPLHARRLRERGYNQAALLAQDLAERFRWAFVPQALVRTRETASQAQLNAHERRQNVAGAFVAAPRSVRGRGVLVVDDVLTTGATLTACAEALRAAGATHVFGLTVAAAVFGGVEAEGGDRAV